MGSAMEVRWDATVSDNCFWSERPLAARPAPAVATHGTVEVRVWPFGILAGSGVQRPILLGLGGGFTLRDVIDGLERRFGAEFLDGMLDEKGELISHCRVFVDGRMIESLAQPVPSGARADVEIILLVATEGG